MTPLDDMWVGLGGGLGSLLRWWTGPVVGEHYHGVFPVGTFLINVSGAFAIGYLSVLFKVDRRDSIFGVLSQSSQSAALPRLLAKQTKQISVAPSCWANFLGM